MRNLSFLKVLVVMVLSVALIVSLSTLVFAANETTDDGFDWDNATVITSNTTNTTGNTVDTNTTGNTVDDVFTNAAVENTNTANSINSNLVTNTNVNVNTTSTNANTNTNKVETLADTGLANNGAMVLVIVVGLIVSIYSYKKIKEYNV